MIKTLSSTFVGEGWVSLSRKFSDFIKIAELSFHINFYNNYLFTLRNFVVWWFILNWCCFFCIKINVIFSPNANKSEVEIHLFRNRLPSVSTMSSFLALYKKRDHCLGSVNRIVYEINYTYPWTVIKSLQFISTNTRKILADRRLSLVEFFGSVLFPIT